MVILLFLLSVWLSNPIMDILTVTTGAVPQGTAYAIATAKIAEHDGKLWLQVFLESQYRQQIGFYEMVIDGHLNMNSHAI